MSDELQRSDPSPVAEPSVLDYVKSLLKFGDTEKIRIPEFVEEDSSLLPSALVQSEESLAVSVERQPHPSAFVFPPSRPFPWRSLVALVLALVAQAMFEPPQDSTPIGIILYILSFSFLGWGIYLREWTLAPHVPHSERADPLTYRRVPLFISLAFALLAFFLFGGNLLTPGNVILWCLAVAFFVYAFWLSATPFREILRRASAFIRRDPWTVNIPRWSLVLLAATVLVFFLRFYQTGSVPAEPFSDHAEKILDVYDVSQGQTHIFFIRNTGREGFQMYWTLLVAKVFGTGLSFLSLKLGTAILGFLTLPFIYLLGKEIGGPRVGLLAFVLAGIAYWPNVISRVGLRFPLYPLFVAPTLLYLIRGLRTRNRNDFLLSGLFLGLGLHGYSPMRIVPIVVAVAFGLYWLHSQSKDARREVISWLAMLALVSLLVFLPLLRYWVDDPMQFGFRALSRLGGAEQPLPGPVHEIFLSNVWNALKMFNYDDGEIWVHSVTHRPALDVVSGALFLIGVMLVLVRYIQNRHWLDIFLLICIPLLLMPSILSLAFPSENPALNRAGGAYVPVFIIAALALDGLVTSFGRGRARSLVAWGLTGLLLFWSAFQNYDLVFRQYHESFRQASWNTSDMGKVVKEFEQVYGTTETIWVVPFPHWVDTRLPAVWVGTPDRDMAMWRENLPSTVELPGPKLFMLKANLEDPLGNDEESLNVLQSLYPDGQLRMFDSDVPGHDFWIFTVPRQ